MKLIAVQYLGFTAMERRFSAPMLPWVVSEIRKRDFCERISLGVEDGLLQAYNSDFEIQFSHNVHHINRFSQADVDPGTFLYVLRDDAEQLLYCFLFQAYKSSDVTDLYQQMKDNTPPRSLSSAASLTSLSVDISPSSSTFFEVLYIGKIKVWHKKVPDTFIDDALEKFKAHDLEKKVKIHPTVERMKSDNSFFRRGSVDSCSSESGSTENLPCPPLQRSSTLSSINVKSTDNDLKYLKTIENSRSISFDKITPYDNQIAHSTICESQDENCDKISEDGASPDSAISPDIDNSNEQNSSQLSDTESVASVKDGVDVKEELFKVSKLPIDVDDHNRTMVLQVGRADLRLISPDRKLVLLHKLNKDVSTCVQGIANSSHFGFICREGANLNTFIGYVFKCESQSVAAETVGAITQAFTNAETKFYKPALTSCEHCPMVWFHKLCVEIENLSDRKTQATIFRRIDQLDEEEQNTILTKFRGAETDSLREQNEFLMMLLRAHCEMKQGRHVHDTAENRSEFLNQYLGGSTIFMKAKRSLTNSFDHLLKRKASKDDFHSILKDMTLPISPLAKDISPRSPSYSFCGDFSDKESEGTRSRSSTIGSQSDLKEARLIARENVKHHSVSPERCANTPEKTLKSPMMEIFFKVGSNPKSNHEEGTLKVDAGSWRQAIFKRVVTPSKLDDGTTEKQRDKEELRILWKKAIHQAVLLVRMEKENAKIRAKQEENAVKRIKLEYDEMKSSQREIMEVWEMLTSKESRHNMKIDNQMLLQAIRKGIPRGKRGEVWQVLAEQFCVNVAPIDIYKFPNYNVSYEVLLKQLTSHQHAILIDLGRTFPSHSYFSSPLGPGQLALFNLLKAYSLLDPEVGYCQGLSFVAGVLLLHMEESQAFFLLRHIMFRRGLRLQYLPDMIGLQVKLYQLSRLLHDQLPDLYNHFDNYEIAPTLYAAPWLLTLFASQFPLGFVTRVFDLLFLENMDVIFRVALALLSLHKENLLKCDSFEEIMNYLKVKLPAIDKAMLDKIIKQVCTTDVSKQLNEYQVEYHVLQEEMASVQPQVDALHKLEVENKIIKEKNKALMAQLELALSNVQRLEKNRTIQQSTTNRLEMQSRGLEVTIVTLGTFIDNLIEQKVDVEIPDDVRRIISQITFCERRKTELKHSDNNLLSMFKKADDCRNPPMVKSLSTGKIGLTDQKALDTMLRSNSLNTQTAKNLQVEQLQPRDINGKPPLKSTISNPNMGAKMSQFFSNSHNQILQQKLHTQNVRNNPKIDITIQDWIEEDPGGKTLSDCTNISTKDLRPDEKSVSLPLSNNNILDYNYTSKNSPTNSIDSGVGTPVSPRDPEPHPLSNLDVQFTYNGTKELKNIRSIRNLSRNSSPDIIGK